MRMPVDGGGDAPIVTPSNQLYTLRMILLEKASDFLLYASLLDDLRKRGIHAVLGAIAYPMKEASGYMRILVLK